MICHLSADTHLKGQLFEYFLPRPLNFPLFFFQILYHKKFVSNLVKAMVPVETSHPIQKYGSSGKIYALLSHTHIHLHDYCSQEIKPLFNTEF